MAPPYCKPPYLGIPYGPPYLGIPYDPPPPIATPRAWASYMPPPHCKPPYLGIPYGPITTPPVASPPISPLQGPRRWGCSSVVPKHPHPCTIPTTTPRDSDTTGGGDTGCCNPPLTLQSLAAELRSLRAQADETAVAHERETKTLREQATVAAKQRDSALREVNPPPQSPDLFPPPKYPPAPLNSIHPGCRRRRCGRSCGW